MNILVSGATGKIGEKLLPLLEKSGHVCFALSRKEIQGEKFRFGNLSNPASLILALKNIDAIIHLAAKTHADKQEEYFSTNTEGTKNLIKAAEIIGVKKFIFISSYTASLNGGAYAVSKYLAEESVQNSKLNWTILHLSEVYGAGKNEAINNLALDIEKKKLIFYPGFKQIFLQPLFINDAISAIISAINQNCAKKIYLIAGPQKISYRELIRKIAEHKKRKTICIPLPIFAIRIAINILSPLGLSPIKKDQLDRLLVNKPSNIDPAKKDLNFNPIDFNEGLQKKFLD